jgi:hypothetical protein
MIKPLLGAMVKTIYHYVCINLPCKDVYPFIYSTGNEINCPGISYFIGESHNIGIEGKVSS